jgi:hypothetical protein
MTKVSTTLNKLLLAAVIVIGLHIFFYLLLNKSYLRDSFIGCATELNSPCASANGCCAGQTCSGFVLENGRVKTWGKCIITPVIRCSNTPCKANSTCTKVNETCTGYVAAGWFNTKDYYGRNTQIYKAEVMGYCKAPGCT